jgi:protein-disulfide isomerase
LKAQNQREKIDELRAAFISKKLELPKEESDKFWPVYNEFQDKQKALKKQLRMAYRKLPEDFSEKEAEYIIDLENKTKLAEAELSKSYSDKLKVLIGQQKMVKLHLAEEEFKREVIKTIKEK